METDRMKVFGILQQYIASESLLRHCISVEIAMRAYAKIYGEDENYWGAVGLLHDIDFEQYPDDHPEHSRPILLWHGYDDDFIRNVQSHARDWNLERTRLQKTLLAVDELTGFIIACALVRPDRSLDNLEVKSVVKKLKDKAFARAVNRDTIKDSAAAMDVDLKEHIQILITAMAKAVHDDRYKVLPLIG